MVRVGRGGCFVTYGDRIRRHHRGGARAPVAGHRRPRRCRPDPGAQRGMRREAAMVEVTATEAPVVAAPSKPAQRWMARLALLTAAAATVLVLVVAGVRGSISLLLVGAVGMALGCAA